MNVQEIIKEYYDGWLGSDREKALSFLADNLKFRSPQDNFDSAKAFLDKCWEFSENFNKMEIEHAVYGPDSAYIVYLGNGFCCGELIKVRGGKISEVYVTFDPTR